MDASKILYWSQGVFLQPQHFQLRDFAAQRRVAALQRTALKHFWGVRRIDVNEAALAAQSFEIRAGEFYFDDGALAAIPETAQPLARSFADVWTESEKPLDVYLALHRFNPWGRNVTETATPEEASQAATRWVTGKDPEEIPDFHADGPTAQIKRLAHALKLFFGPEQDLMSDYHVIRVARLTRDGEKTSLSPGHIPPCPDVGASRTLVNIIQEIRDLTSARCRVLEQYKSPNSAHSAGMDMRYMIYLMALMTLNRHLPALIHFKTADCLHPYEVYGELTRFIGELSTFSFSLNASGEARDGTVVLPPYDHNNLGPCFQAARKLCGELLEGIILGPEYLLALNRKEGFFAADPPEGVFKADHAYWLILKSAASLKDLAGSVNQRVKLSASPSISTLIALAVPGAGLEYSEDPPSGMPRDAAAVYFKIDRNCPQWLEIEKTRAISMYWPEAPEDLVAEIAVMRG